VPDWAAPPSPADGVPGGWPAAAPGGRVAARRAARPRGERTALAAVGYLALLTCVATGLFLVWLGADRATAGMVVAGCGLLAAAMARLVLPERLAGLLACRRRVPDVAALAVLGIGLLVMGTVLPGLRAAIRTSGMAGPSMKGITRHVQD